MSFWFYYTGFMILAMSAVILHFSAWARYAFANRVAKLPPMTIWIAFLTGSGVSAHIATIYAGIAWLVSIVVFSSVFCAMRWRGP